METTIKNVIELIREYHQLITKADNDDSLTTIQKEEYAASIKQKLEKKGIKYHFFNTHFYFSSLFVNDTGIIKDVATEGSYPIRLKMGTNIFVSFDPRNLNKPNIYRDANIPIVDGLKSTQYLHLRKESSYSFSGKVDRCICRIGPLPLKEEFEFYIQDIKGQKVKKGDGCFIATACYGNYDSPEVLVLRQFRDDKLLKTFFGKVFVKLYYSVSPFFATLILKSDLLKISVRQYFLEPIVTKLQRQIKNSHRFS